MPTPKKTDLTVAVTGPTGTFGYGLMPLLEADDRVSRVVGIARRPFDPGELGWTKMDYRRGDVREVETLRAAFEGADVVVHLAFLIVGDRRSVTRAVNVEGTVNALRAAADAGARRFVYASSVAAYGFHDDNPVGMREDWPTRPAHRLFYAQQKAELEELIASEAAQYPDLDVYLLRPHIVVGPHAVGGKVDVPAPVGAVGRGLGRALTRLPVRLPVPVPELPLQLVHEDDVGSALLACVVADGPPGAYNIAGDGELSALDVARELGFLPVPVPAGPTYAVSRALARLPLPAKAQWVEAASHPTVMDTSKARTELGWSPRYTSLEALRSMLSD
jgi:nucleoside-diphosphate-sugar epimerase